MHFVFSYFRAKRRRAKRRKDKKKKKSHAKKQNTQKTQKNARQKDEITPCETTERRNSPSEKHNEILAPKIEKKAVRKDDI